MLRVADTGAGLSAEEKARVFERFYQSGGNGSGIGLALVHELVTKLEGEIVVSSEPGKGAEFTVSLPHIPGARPQDAKKVVGKQSNELRPGIKLEINDPSLKAFVIV